MLSKEFEDGTQRFRPSGNDGVGLFLADPATQLLLLVTVCPSEYIVPKQLS